MEFYGDSISGNCLKLRYTADLLGIPYTWCETDLLAGETRTPAFLRMNPAGQVPVMKLDDGRCLAQSNAIITYLAEGSALFPDDRYQRALISQWLYWEQYSHEPYVAVCRFHMKYLGRSASERESWRVEKGEAALDLMEASLQAGDWLAGDEMTLADISLFAYTSLCHEGGFSLCNRRAISH